MERLPLILRDFAGDIEVTPEAFHWRESALKRSSVVVTVTNADEQMIAVQSLRELKDIAKGMETTRKSVKAPVLALCEKIDDKAHDFMQSIDKQIGRLTGLINHFQRKQIEKQRAEAAKIEADKVLAEKIAKKAESETDPKKKAELEAAAIDAKMNAEVASVPTVAKPKGLTVRQRVNFKIVNPIVFIQAYPDFFKWKPDNESFKLDRIAVLEELNREDGKGVFHKTHFPEELPDSKPELVKPPGMEVFFEVKAH